MVLFLVGHECKTATSDDASLIFRGRAGKHAWPQQCSASDEQASPTRFECNFLPNCPKPTQVYVYITLHVLSLSPATRSSRVTWWASLSENESFALWANTTVHLGLAQMARLQSKPRLAWLFLFGWHDAKIVESMCETCNFTAQVSLSIMCNFMSIYLFTPCLVAKFKILKKISDTCMKT